MPRPKWLLPAAFATTAGIAAAAYTLHASYRQSVAEADDAYASIVSEQARGDAEIFDPSMVDDLPEIGRRYFGHAIAPGTRLRRVVSLEMRGKFLLGEKGSTQTYSMRAKQALAAPAEFVWIPIMKSGAMTINGSDAAVGGRAWTRFWLNTLIPVVNVTDTSDLRRSASTRSAMESIWAPASLLPSNGVLWEQIGPDTARLSFDTGIEPIEMKLATDGRVVEMRTLRWSDANADKTFRLQPFGGTMIREKTFHGFTIPSEISVGNHFGTPDYVPFFQAEIIEVDYR